VEPRRELGENTLAMAELSRQVQALVRRQDGVVARAQLLARGMTEGAVDHARACGRLVDVHPGVYAVAPLSLLSADARLIAASLVFRHRAVVSHLTAALRWQLVPAAGTQVDLASRLELVAPPGITFHRTTLRAGDVTRDGRIRLTTPTRTLLDLAVRFHRAPLLAALAEAEYHHRVRPADVLAVLRRGHPGSASLRAALEEHVPGFGEMRSRLERRFRGLLIEHGVELPWRNARIGPWTVDCLWADLGVVVELDGEQHQRPHQAAVDAERDLWLRRRGYVVRRYTDAQVKGPARHQVIADLRDAFAEGAARSGTAARAERSGTTVRPA
jgi:very-short-patch-repair endonuclease